MRTLSDAVKAWKNQDGIKDPMAILYEIQVSDALTVRLVRGDPLGTGFVAFEGETFLAAGIGHNEVNQTIEGDLSPVEVGISNIDGVAGGYIEQFDLEGRKLIIRQVLTSTLELIGDAREFTIEDQSYDRKIAAVTCGETNLFKKIIPSKRFIRHRCQWDWENRHIPGNGCGFPSDQFADDTTQDFVLGALGDAEQKRKHGWYTLNATKASRFNVNSLADGVLDHLFIESSSDAIDWAGENRDGPFVYRKLVGDFDVYTQVDPKDFRAGGIMGVICQEDAAPQDSWIILGRARDEGDEAAIRVYAAIDGVGQTAAEVLDPASTFVRMKRAGDVFSSYYATLEPAPLAQTVGWTHIEDRTIAMSSDIRIGCGIGGGNSSALAVQFPYFQFIDGGPDVCDRTEGGALGCGAKNWLHRFFAFRGIPRL